MKEESSSNYIKTYPSNQNAINIFKHEWSSKFPDHFDVTTFGKAELFEDQRITWAEDHGVCFKNKSVLELGPLEAGHTWMMDQRGTKEILSIEAHERAYLKCLIVKEITSMKTARFLHGNFDEYLGSSKRKFDICLASGVLYHSHNPLTLLENICECSNQIILWTHYYDYSIINSLDSDLKNRFSAIQVESYHDHRIQLHGFKYQEEAKNDAFCGGLNPNSIWLELNDIRAILEINKFQIIAEGFNHPHHPNGPAIALLAQRNDYAY
jgi:hypothetical protein